MLAHAKAHTYTLTILHFTAFDGTTSPHLSSESCHAWPQKRSYPAASSIFFTELTLTHTHMTCVCTPVSDMKGRWGLQPQMCCLICVCICPLFFCLLLVPWNLTGALLFIHFILFVCSLSLCMCVCQLLYRPAAYSDHSRPRYAQTCDGEGIQ